MENQTKYYGIVGNMYVSNIFPNAGKLSLSCNIDDACIIYEKDWKWLKLVVNAKIVKVTTVFEEMKDAD